MADRTIIVGRYTERTAAHLALARLQELGIRATLTGDEAGSMFPGNVLLTQYQLQVAESDKARALEALFDAEVEELDPNWEEKIDNEEGWLCSLCGSVVKDDVEICPDCQTERTAVKAKGGPRRVAPVASIAVSATDSLQTTQSPSSPPTPLHEPTMSDDEIDIPDEDELRVDSLLAKRAMRAAMLGWITLVFTIYSIYLIVYIANMPGKLTPRAVNHLWWAVAFNLTSIPVLSILVVILFGPIFR